MWLFDCFWNADFCKGTTAQEFLARPRTTRARTRTRNISLDFLKKSARPRATRAQPRSFIFLHANCDLIRMLLIFHLKEYVCSLPSQMNWDSCLWINVTLSQPLLFPNVNFHVDFINLPTQSQMSTPSNVQLTFAGVIIPRRPEVLIVNFLHDNIIVEIFVVNLTWNAYVELKRAKFARVRGRAQTQTS